MAATDFRTWSRENLERFAVEATAKLLRLKGTSHPAAAAPVSDRRIMDLRETVAYLRRAAPSGDCRTAELADLLALVDHHAVEACCLRDLLRRVKQACDETPDAPHALRVIRGLLKEV